jgi:enoyl-CoA hydratase
LATGHLRRADADAQQEAAMTMLAVEPAIVASRQGRMGHILLNRPRALNALDPGMIRGIAAALAEWRDDPAVEGVMVEGAGDRAFCAGGDIRAIRELAVAGEHDRIGGFFAEEYALNRMIAEYPKPYVALIDGICLGGGVGISVHGTARIATEAAVFAMPETAIGFFPDVGMSHVLPRLPGALGMYLGLTGTRLAFCDAVHAGIATHAVPAADLGAIRAGLIAEGPGFVAGIASFAAPFSLEFHRPAIDRCFGADSVAGIVAALGRERTIWARDTLKLLRSMSPSAVLWSFALLRRGAARSLADCLAAELALSAKVTAHPDFAEGVRAMVVDKDRQPRWSPARIEEVDPARIEALFNDL